MPETRVAIVVPDGIGGHGGIARTIDYLTRALKQRAPDIDVSVLSTRYTENELLKHLTTPLALAAFALRVVSQKIDIAHFNIAPRGSTWRKMVFARVADALGARVVLHLHGSAYDVYYASLSPRRRAMVRAFFGRAARVVVLSRFWKDFALTELGVPEARIVEIPNGVPHPGLAAKPHAQAEAPLIVFLGLVGRRKGTDVLLEALARLQQRGVAFRATIGGDGDVDQARDHAGRLGLTSSVAFAGWIGEAEVDGLLRQADIYVLPSRGENQPVSILEAMARGLPVVSTRIGAIPDQVVDGETGELVPPGEVEPLAEALERLLGDRDLRERMGRAGFARFEALFSIEASADRFAALYSAERASRHP